MSGTSSKIDIPRSDPTTIVDLDLQDVLVNGDPANTLPADLDEAEVHGADSSQAANSQATKSTAGSSKSPVAKAADTKATKSKSKRRQAQPPTGDTVADTTSEVDDEWIERQIRRRQERMQRWLGKPAPYRPKNLPTIVTDVELEADQPSSLGRLLGSCPGWLGSAFIHVVLLLVLSLITLSRVAEDRKIVLLGDAEPKKVEPLIVDVEVSVPTISTEQTPINRIAGQVRPDKRAGRMPAVLPQFTASSKKRAGPIGSVRSLFGSGGIGGAEFGSGKGGAEFFGVKATGSKFVFVVDSSRSMTGPKWYDACAELLAAIQRLRADQRFFVIFFDGIAHPMPVEINGFWQRGPPQGLLRAEPKNVANLQEFISTLQLGFDTRPFAAVRMAMSLQPDAIYLLSDGEFKDNTARYLKRNNRIKLKDRLKMPAVVVHTIGFHSRAGQRVLRRIAKDNGGTYKYVSGRRSRR